MSQRKTNNALIRSEGKSNTYTYRCPYCGAYLDPGEVCDCQRGRAEHARMKVSYILLLISSLGAGIYYKDMTVFVTFALLGIIALCCRKKNTAE